MIPLVRQVWTWMPYALPPGREEAMRAWGFAYKPNPIVHKARKHGGVDGRGVGVYFRNVTEVLLFGVRGTNVWTLTLERSQVNMLQTRELGHSGKADKRYALIEACSAEPRLELFERGERSGNRPVEPSGRAR